jgi:threonine synthase
MQLADVIDCDVPADRSIVLRYLHAFAFGEPAVDRQFKDHLAAASIREGARIVPLVRYRGVDIWLMDETSYMHTKTLKSIDGCVTTAKCKLAGIDRVVLETGGNTGSALTVYGTRCGLDTYCFVPAENLSLLDSRSFSSTHAHLVAVEDPGSVKAAARALGEMLDLTHIPKVAWRYDASRFRGMLILEHELADGRFDWIAQSISAAFGPIGIYWTLGHFGPKSGRLPRFLGVQQRANCPMYRSWAGRRKTLRATALTSTTGLLARTMYDVKPHTYGTYRELLGLLEDTKGELLTIDHGEFERFLTTDLGGQSVRELLAGLGINIGQEVVEKTGLMALAGTLKLIDAGGVPRGKRILCCLTSGIPTGDGRARPEFTIRNLRSVLGDYRQQLRQVTGCA